VNHLNKIRARVTNPRDRSDHHHSCCETTSRFSPRCILSRQPARTSLRFAATAALRFAPPGVRSGTLPTVGVAKGKIAKCRVYAPFADFKNSWTPGPLIIAVKVESILYTGSFPLHFRPSLQWSNLRQPSLRRLNFLDICEVPKASYLKPRLGITLAPQNHQRERG
jgi:hypothetical protein